MLALLNYLNEVLFIGKETPQLNGEIKDRELRVITASGEQLGIMSAKDALHEAEKRGQDLVKIAPQAKPPVAKIMDYSKFRYEQAKREKENRKKQKIVDTKEIRLSLNIDIGDFNTKVNQAKKFLSKGKLEDVVQQMVAGCNRVVNEATPIVDARLEDGSRVNVVLPPVALNGPIVTIRKFPKSRITMETMIDTGSIGKEAATMLIQAVKAKYNIFISGGTGSGKTTFLNVLSDFIPKEERIITIEDSAELQITGIPNLVRLEARNANVEGTGEINIRDLIRKHWICYRRLIQAMTDRSVPVMRTVRMI